MSTIRDADLKRLMIAGQVGIVIALLVANHVAPRVGTRQRTAEAITSGTRHLTAEAIAKRVALIYGETHPRLARVAATQADPDGTPMYIIVLDGRFEEEHLVARHLEFSALADRFFVWGRRGYDGPQRPLFVDDANLGHL